MTTGSERPAVCGYDFKHPARVNREQLRTIENLHENGARLFSSTFSTMKRSLVEVRTAFVDQTTYGEFIASLSNPGSAYQYVFGPSTGHAIMDFEMPLVFGVIDRCFGGKGSSAGMDARQMTQTEMGMFAKLVKRIIWDTEALWEPVIPDVSIHDIELETNPEFMQITANSEVVVLVALEVESAHMKGLIRLCYPFFTLQPFLQRLSQPGVVSRPGPARDATRARNRLALGAMDLPAVVELGRTRVAAATAASLQPGDVIRLDAQVDDPACLYLGGQPRFLGFPCAEGGDLSLRIAGRVPAAQASTYGRVAEPARSARSPLVPGQDG